MFAKTRLLVAAALVLVFGLVAVFRPGPDEIVRVQAGKLLEGSVLPEYESWLTEELAAIGELRFQSAKGKLPFSVPPELEGQLRFARIALRGIRAPVSFQVEVPKSWGPEFAKGLEEKFQSWAKASQIVQAPPSFGFPLRVSWSEEEESLRLITPAIPVGEGGKTRLPGRSFAFELAELWSLVPAFLVILCAVLLGRTIPSLLLGVLVGAVLASGSLWAGLFDTFLEEYLVRRALLDSFRIDIITFVLFLSASVGVMTRMGGLEGMVRLVRKFAKSARSSQLVTWFLGILIFFDDYANTIVVGSTMRPLMDRMKVSREKLSYIVDATAAPIAGLAVLSTWVAYEISTFSGQLPLVQNPDGVAYSVGDGFSIFLQTMPFRFYCYFTIFMVFATIVWKREFGPMLSAERRARQEGKVLADDATPLTSRSLTDTKPKAGASPRWWNGVLPIVTLVLVTAIMIAVSGEQGVRSAVADEGLDISKTDGFAYLRLVLEKANSAGAIFWGAFASWALSMLLSVSQRLLGPVEALWTGLRSMWGLAFAVVILFLAWCIGYVCEDLGTAYFLVGLTQGSLMPQLLPTLLFVIACLVAFATGSSWSTMSILLPNVVLLAHSLGQGTDLGGPGLMVLSIGAVLEGSIFGDHCSPISDTTVLSSVSSASDHLHHVRTQAPYAILIMLVSIVFGYLPVAFLSPALWPICMISGLAAITSVLFLIGRNPERPVAVESAPPAAGSPPPVSPSAGRS